MWSTEFSEALYFVAGRLGSRTVQPTDFDLLNVNKKAQLTQREARDSLGI